MHPFAPHYERKTRSDHGKKRPRDSNASSSSTTLNHPSLSHPLDDTIDENDEESFHSNSSSPSQNVSSSSKVEMKARGVKGDHLHLLKDVSAAYTPGILTSLAGVIRVGKITLMDVLADELIKLMELNHTRDALVGLPAVDGLSIEQRKQLTVAVELVANPFIISYDEPNLVLMLERLPWSCEQ
ncbi:hypothetical protein Tco_0895707 [Tanacetum coccineum]|uniref:ABC transporter domain-containing protein n=1 Tax=Tanacetum coccineum TaxID=301880 RepID=A0ABQ5CFE0_9ASTR